MPRTCLVIVDVQLRYVDSVTPQFAKSIHELIARARASHVPIVYIMHDIQAGDTQGHNPALSWVNETHDQGYGINHCMPLEFAWPCEGELVVMKRSFDSFHDTGLCGILRDMKVDRIILAGLLTGICVLSSCLSAVARGFHVDLVRDATTDGSDRANLLLSHVYPSIAHITTVAQVLPAVPGVLPFRPRQDMLNHLPAIAACGTSQRVRPTRCVLMLLNATAQYLTPVQLQEMQQLSTEFEQGGIPVFNVGSRASRRSGVRRGVFDGRTGTALHDELRRDELGCLLVAGARSGVEVVHLVLDAFNRGFWITLITDRLYDPDQKRAHLGIAMRCYQGHLVQSVQAHEVVPML